MGISSRSCCLVRQRFLWRARFEFCEVDSWGTGSVRPSCWSPCIGSYISVICYFSKQCCNLPFYENDGGRKASSCIQTHEFRDIVEMKWRPTSRCCSTVPLLCSIGVRFDLCFYLTKLSLDKTVSLEWKNDLWLMNGKGCGAKRLWLNWRPV